MMNHDRKSFQLPYKDQTINVQRHSVGGTTVFRISFSDRRPPLVITRARHQNAFNFWTSIPEGRQTEAEEIGPLIAEFYEK
ncbi:MAG: hypothetical protein ACTHM5_07170 [Ginsengibacter sp.]